MTYGLNSGFKKQLNNKSKNKRLLSCNHISIDNYVFNCFN